MKKITKKISRKSGQVMLTVVVFFMFASMTIVFGVINPILKQVAVGNTLVSSNGSYFLAQSALEDAYYRLKYRKQVGPTETLSLNGGTTNITITDTVASGKKIISDADVYNHDRKMEAVLVIGSGVSFNYGVQSGRGGFYLENSSSITGNIHSAGPVIGAGNIVRGDVVSSGPTGLVDGILATGTVFSHNITNSTVGKDAHYVNISGTTVTGTLYPGSADQPEAPFPIPDSQIAQWESDAAAGGTLSCTNGKYTVSFDMTLGPNKIPCNLEIKGSGITLTVAGPLWVTGNITTQVSPMIRMAAALGSSNVAVIADNPSDTTGSGIITIGQNTTFAGSGSPNSFVFMITQNNSAETGGNTNAIVMGQGSSALVAYANHGQITLQQSVGVIEVTAYKIILQNTANVVYDTGLPSVLFQSGPSGGYAVLSWKEIE